MSVAALNVELGLGSAKFRDGINAARAKLTEFEKSAAGIAKKLDKFGKSMESIGKKLSTNLSLPIAAAGAALGLAINKTSEYGDELVNMANRTGASFKQLQELKFQATQVGVSFEGVEGALIKLSKSMGDAMGGSKEASAAFGLLGVSLTDSNGNAKTSSDVFTEVVDRLSRVGDETTRNALGMDIFGKGFAEIIPIVNEGKDGLNKYADEAARAGLIMSDDAIRAADDFGDSVDKLKQQFEHATMGIAAAFMPILKDTLIPFIEGKVIPVIKAVGDWFNSLSPTAKTVGLAIAGIAAAAGPAIMIFGSLWRNVSSLIPLFAGISLPVAAAAAAIGGAAYLIIKYWEPISGFFQRSWESIKASISTGIQTSVMVIASGITKMLGIVQAGVGFFSDEWAKGVEDAKESVDELARSIIQSTSTVFATTPAIKAADSSLDTFEKTAAKAKSQVKDLNISLQKTAENLGYVSSSGVMGMTQQQIDNLRNKVGLLGSTFNTGSQEIMQVGNEMFVAGEKAIGAGIKVGGFASSFAASMATVKEATATFTVDTAALWNDGIEAMTSGLAEFMVGTEKTSTVFDSVLMAIVNWGLQVSKAMIAAGVASLAFQKTIATNPVLAIAAGVALGVALKVVKTSMEAPAMAQGGLVFGETLALVGEGRGTTSSNPEVIAPLDKLMDFLVPPAQSGGGQFEFIISGENLRAIQNRNNKFRQFGSGK